MAHEDTGDLNKLWQDQPEEARMALEDVRKRARRWERTVGRRNLLEYAAALFVIVSTAMKAWHETNAVVLFGGVLLMLGTVYVVPPAQMGLGAIDAGDVALMDCLNFHRAELGRQRDLLRGVWWWYLLPLVPGPALIIIGRAIERPDRRLLALGVAATFVVTFTLIGKLNERGARRLQGRIDDLDRVR